MSFINYKLFRDRKPYSGKQQKICADALKKLFFGSRERNLYTTFRNKNIPSPPNGFLLSASYHIHKRVIEKWN